MEARQDKKPESKGRELPTSNYGGPLTPDVNQRNELTHGQKLDEMRQLAAFQTAAALKGL
jgi:hypothetical protein